MTLKSGFHEIYSQLGELSKTQKDLLLAHQIL